MRGKVDRRVGRSCGRVWSVLAAAGGLLAATSGFAAGPGDPATPLPPCDAARVVPADGTPPPPEPCAVAILPGAEAPVDDRKAAELNEVTVTANKRKSSVRDVAGSVGVVKGSDLEKSGATGMQDYLKLVPGVTLPDVGNENSTPIIRGISTSIVPGDTQATTGIFIDETSLSDPFIPTSVPDINPFDLERVEVLKGPVGTLFGADSLAGAVRYIPRRPQLGEWDGKLLAERYSVTDGGTISPTAGAEVNLPLGSTVAVRAVGIYRKYNGLIDDQDSRREEADADKLKQVSTRFMGTWKPFDRLQFEALYQYQRTSRADESFTDQPFTYARADEPFPTVHHNLYKIMTFDASYSFDWSVVKAVTSLVRKSVVEPDADIARFNTELGLIQSENLNDTQVNGGKILNYTYQFTSRAYNQELRFQSPENHTGPVDWLVGASYYQAHYNDIENGGDVINQTLAQTPVSVLLPVGPFTGTNDFENLYLNIQPNAKEYAAFSDVTRKLGSHWVVEAGLRLFRSTLSTHDYLAGLQPTYDYAAINYTFNDGQSSRGLNPKFSLRYLLNRNIQAYVLASKGYQYGGVQVTPVTSLTSQSGGAGSGGDITRYKSSSLWNYEAGIRTDWFHHHLSFDSTFFYLSWKDLQLTQQVQSFLLPALTEITNVGHAHSEGAEVALSIGPFPVVPGGRLSFTSSAASINAVTDVQLTAVDGTNVPAGTRLPGTPKFQIANTLTYEQTFQLWTEWQVGLNLTHTFLGQSYNDLEYPYQAPQASSYAGSTTTLPIAELGGYSLWDARAHLKLNSAHFAPDISVSVHNVFNRLGVAGLNTGRGEYSTDYYLTAPRTLLLQLAVPFF